MSPHVYKPTKKSHFKLVKPGAYLPSFSLSLMFKFNGTSSQMSSVKMARVSGKLKL